MPSTFTVDFTLSTALFNALRSRQRTSTDLFAWGSSPQLAIRHEGLRATTAQAAWVSGAAFSTLGVNADLGRTITEQDDHEGGDSGGWVADITNKYWRSAFGGRSYVIGARLTIQGVPVTIVGVLPPHFTGVLAVASGVSLFRLMTSPTGMTTSPVVVIRPDFRTRAERGEQRHALDERIVGELRAQRGVAAAGVTTEPPMQNERASGHYRAISATSSREDASVPELAVGPGYFDTIGLRFLLGRDFTAADRRGTPDVCAVNASAATFFFGAANSAIGRQLERISGERTMRCEIVAVVEAPQQAERTQS